MPGAEWLLFALAALAVLLEISFLGFLLLRSNTAPAVRIAWILVALMLPVVCVLLYLRFGRLPGRQRSGVRPLAAEIRALGGLEERPPGDAVLFTDPVMRRGSTMISRLGGFAATGGNLVALFGDPRGEGSAAIDAMVSDIEHAEHTCHLLTYIYLADRTGTRVADSLLAARRRGVACRLLVDDVGSSAFLRSALCSRLHQGGVTVARAEPVHPLRALFQRFDQRNHRKLLIVDGRVAWLGSQNIADPGFAPKARYAPWVDVLVRLEGPVAHDLARVFAGDWLVERGDYAADLLSPRPLPVPGGVIAQVLPSGPGADAETLRRLLQLAFLETDDELVVTTPYFVPDQATLSALATSASSGVAVTLVVPRRNDSRLVGAASRSYYETQLVAGVRIFEKPLGLLHAKTFTFDDQTSLIGTAFLDRRSFELNYEVGVLVRCREFAQCLRALQHGYVALSQRVDPAAFAARAHHRRLAENVAGLFSPLL